MYFFKEIMLMMYQSDILQNSKFKKMDRSNVRESYMRTSYVFNNNSSNTVNRSFISTALMSDSLAYGDDLRKSRIQNLPNYKKINLGDNIQFIVVFQTIQIERLSNEVEVLRVKLKESERQLFNAQNYEVQIRQLTEKCFSLQRLREEYCEEIEKLTKICDTLFHQNQALKSKLNEMDYSLKQKFELEKQKNQDLNQEIEKWKARYQAAQKSKAKQLEDLRNLMECQRKSMIDRQIRQITIRFQNQRSSLENEIRKNREMLENRNRQIDDLRQKCQKYEISIMELKNYENMIADHQNKLALLQQELLRLSDVLERKEDEIQRFKERQYQLKQQLKEQKQWEYENKQLRNNLQNRTKQIQEWRIRTMRLEDEANKSREMIHYNEQLTNKLQVSGTEIERLNKVLRAKLDEIQQWKNKVQKRDMQISKLRNLENQLPNYENKLSMMAAQNNRLDGILKSRITEIQEWRNKCSKLQNNNKEIGRIEDQKRALQDKLNNHVRNSEEMSRTIVQYEKQLGNLRNIQNRGNQLQRQNGIMSKQIQRLNGVIRNYSNQIDDYRVKESRFEKTLAEYKNGQEQKRDLTHKINILTQQKQRLNNLMRAKNDDIQALQNEKLELHTKINHYKNYQSKISESQGIASKLKDQINRLRGELEGWQSKANTADNKNRQFEHHLFISNSQKQKLNNMLKNKSNEYQDLRGKYARMETESRRTNQLENIIQEQHNQIVRYMEDLEHLQKNIAEYAQQLEREKQVSNQFAYKIIVLSCELERISASGGGKSGINSREYQELQQDYSRLQSKVVSKNNEIDILNNRISSLEQKVNQLIVTFNQLLAEVQKSDQETESLYRRIQEYQDYAKRIHILSAEIDRLQAENKAYDEDARRIRLKFADGLAQEKKQEDFNFMLVLMALQIENLRSRLDQREMNIDQMRKSILDPVRRI